MMNTLYNTFSRYMLSKQYTTYGLQLDFYELKPMEVHCQPGECKILKKNNRFSLYMLFIFLFKPRSDQMHILSYKICNPDIRHPSAVRIAGFPPTTMPYLNIFSGSSRLYHWAGYSGHVLPGWLRVRAQSYLVIRQVSDQ